MLRAQQGEHLLALAGYAEVVDTWYRGGDGASESLSTRRVLGILVELGVLELAAVLHGALDAVGVVEAVPIAPAEAERLSGSGAEERPLLGPRPSPTLFERARHDATARSSPSSSNRSRS